MNKQLTPWMHHSHRWAQQYRMGADNTDLLETDLYVCEVCSARYDDPEASLPCTGSVEAAQENTMTAEPTLTATTLLDWEKKAQQAFPEREQGIRALMIAYVARLDTLLEGPPGTGKTELIKAFSHALSKQLFKVTLSSWTDDKALLGQVDIAALQQGELRYNGTGMLADCDIAFLDELPRAGRGIRDMVLSTLAERQLPDGTPVRARIVTAAANKPLVDDEDLALADRFSLCLYFDKVKDTNKRTDLICSMDPPALPPLQLPDDISQVELPLWLRTACGDISGEIGSVRRWRQAMKGIRANALIEGRTEATWDDAKVVLPMAIPGPGGDIHHLQALMDEYGPQGDQATQQFEELCERLVVELGEKDPADLNEQELVEYGRRWNTIDEMWLTLRNDHPDKAADFKDVHSHYQQRDREIQQYRLDAITEKARREANAQPRNGGNS